MRAVAALSDFRIIQSDVKAAFLNVKLGEKLFMEQPDGFVNRKHP